MSKDIKKNYRGKMTKGRSALPFSSENYYFFAIGIALIVMGYISLSRGPWDSFWSLTLAPILLVLGYCVIVPIALLYRKKSRKQEDRE